MHLDKSSTIFSVFMLALKADYYLKLSQCMYLKFNIESFSCFIFNVCLLHILANVVYTITLQQNQLNDYILIYG